MDSSKAQSDRLGSDVEAWNAAVAARDAEIQNLQVGIFSTHVMLTTFICPRCCHFRSRCIHAYAPLQQQQPVEISAQHWVTGVQAALGELAYSSEAAERLRAELRAAATKLRSAQEEVAGTKRELAEGAAARQTLEAQLAALREEQQKQSEFAARLSVRESSQTTLILTVIC